MIITISSTNGGTGKTTISLTLANIFFYQLKKKVHLYCWNDKQEDSMRSRDREVAMKNLNQENLYPISKLDNFGEIAHYAGAKDKFAIIDMSWQPDNEIIKQSDLALITSLPSKLDFVSLLTNNCLDFTKSFVLVNNVMQKYKDEEHVNEFIDLIDELVKYYHRKVKFTPFIFEDQQLSLLNSTSISTAIFEMFKPLVDFIYKELELNE